MERLKIINNDIKKLKLILRNSNVNSSILELTDILSSTEEARSFIYLLDKIDTDKELTREILEDLIEYTHEFNSQIILHMELENSRKILSFDRWINFSNFKTLVILSVMAGIILGISGSDSLITMILSYFGIGGK